MHAIVATAISAAAADGITPADNAAAAALVDAGVNAGTSAVHRPWWARTGLALGDARVIGAFALTRAARVHDDAGAIGTMLEARAAAPGGGAGAVGAARLARAAGA